MRLTVDVANAVQHVESPLNVNVIYQIPGNILKPDFEGVRTGHYSKEDSSLIVQAALPDDARRTSTVISSVCSSPRLKRPSNGHAAAASRPTCRRFASSPPSSNVPRVEVTSSGARPGYADP